MEPASKLAALSRRYENDVAAALARANTEVTFPAGAPAGIVVVQGLSWRILVAARYGDDGTSAVKEAEDGAARMRTNGSLAIVNRTPADEAIRHCRQALAEGRAVAVTRWADTRDDGSLKRSLVSLFH